MNWLPFLIVCPLTFLAGLVDSIAGGGGLISLPAFMIVGLPVHTAIATNKLTSTIGTSVSTARYCRHGYFDRGLVLPTVALALCGSVMGARLVLLVEERYLRWLLVALLPVVAVVVLLDKNPDAVPEPLPRRRQLVIACATALVVGTYDGFYGPGTGTFLLLALTHLAHLDACTASGNVKLINLASNTAALVTFLFSGAVNVTLGLAGAVFCLAGHYMGAGLVMKNGTRIIRPIILVVLALLFVKVIFG